MLGFAFLEDVRDEGLNRFLGHAPFLEGAI